MKALWALGVAVVVTAVAWLAGGILATWLTDPGYFVMWLLTNLGLPLNQLLSIKSWLFMGSIANVLAWWLGVYLLLKLRERVVNARRSKALAA